MAKIPKYKLSDAQKRSLSAFPRRLVQVGVLFLATGLVRLILGVGSVSSGGWGITAVVFLLFGVIDVLLGTILWLSSDKFMKVIEIDSCGIEQLMTGMEELSTGFRIAQYLGISAAIMVILDFAFVSKM